MNDISERLMRITSYTSDNEEIANGLQRDITGPHNRSFSF